jgi:hypothetical protein
VTALSRWPSAATLSRADATGVRIERVVLALDRAALAGVAVGHVALGDEPAGARFARGREQVVGPFAAEPVRLGEGAIEMLEVAAADARQRGRLIDDRVGPGGGNRLAHCPRVERVEHSRLGSEPAQPLCLLGRAGAADHLVAALQQLGDEPAADRTARPYHEDSHRSLLFVGGLRASTMPLSACGRIGRIACQIAGQADT